MARLFGRATAYFVGGLLLQLYTHFDTVDRATSVYAIFLPIYFTLFDTNVTRYSTG